jgi:hypothetical protein
MELLSNWCICEYEENVIGEITINVVIVSKIVSVLQVHLVLYLSL